MQQTSQYRHFDTKRSNGSRVYFERVLAQDHDASPSDFDCYDEEQKAAWRKGEWCFVGVIARARIEVTRNGVGTSYTLDSPGVWAVESDSGDDYLNELYREQREELLADLIEMARFSVENT